MNTAIEIKDLVKKFGTKTAVKGLNLTVDHGEFFSLLGVNGAGKTTTIKMLTGLLIPTSGDAVLDGHSVVTDTEAVKTLTNVSPQETAIAPNLTVRENLEFIAGIYGVENVKVKTDEIIEKFELSEIANDRAKTLSGGWQRRLSIAMALITSPQILFLDEPTLGLDVIARKELWKTISELKGKVTVVLTTHYLEEAEALSDRIAIMSKGELKAVGTPAELIEKTKKATFEDAFIELAAGEVAE